MNDIQLHNFITIANAGSFSKAEALLNTTKTALKKQMDTLENELGFKLFFRTSKGLNLTKAGTLFFEKMSVLYDDYLNIVQECRALEAQFQPEIKIGMYTITNMVNWYLNIEHNSHFKIQHFYISDSNSTHEDNLNLLKENKIDFLEYEDNDLIFEKKLCFKRIVTDHLCCVMKANHPLAGLEVIHPEDLASYSIYCWTSSSSATRALSRLASVYNLKLQPIPYSINNVLSVCSVGNIYILSRYLANKFRPLKIIPITPLIPYYRGLVYKPEHETLIQEMLKIANPGTLNTDEA